MKQEIEYKRIVEKILEILRQYNCTPKEVRQAFKLARQQGKYQIPKESKVLPNYLNKSEIDYIIEKAYKESVFDGTLLKFQIHTGLRINETKNILIQHIDFNGDILKVVRGKGNKDRFVPISRDLKQSLITYLNGRSKGYVFCKSNETPLTKRALQYRIENIIKKCNFNKKITTHGLRHTFACMLLAKGLPLERIQLIMGHEKITTTQIYAKLELGQVKEEFIRLLGE